MLHRNAYPFNTNMAKCLSTGHDIILIALHQVFETIAPF